MVLFVSTLRSAHAILFSIRCSHDRQLEEACLAGRMINTLRGFLGVCRLRPKNVRDERLRIPVVQREPAGLYLHHDPMPGKEDMIRGRQRIVVEQGLVGRDRLRLLQTLAVASAEDVGGQDRKSTRLNSSHQIISYAVFCLKKKKNITSR